ncbi:hypothetical protein ACHHYP_14065 [Achlya hypogyna]|uniref:Uncharacterized protein n=1 Tax=Achlya hypogyna TaxID=1202772 RepID=A0A1V9YE26_ACHHY|nr:hypothetical protein ACHHYP_14065 [Achlya hypogyna]
MYLESLLRNIDKHELNDSAYGRLLRATVFAGIAPHCDKFWLASVLEAPWVTLSDEVDLWHNRSLSYWQTEVTNYYQQGLDNTIAIVNAFGLRQNVTINHTPRQFRGLALWSLLVAYDGLWNDLFGADSLNMSLVRNVSSASNKLQDNWEMLQYALTGSTPVMDLVHSFLGPYGSIDVTLQAKPPELLAQFNAFQGALRSHLIASLPIPPDAPVIVTPVPTEWSETEYKYYGGNPMCVESVGRSAPQQLFNFYDSCGSNQALVVSLSRSSAVFAVWMSGISRYDADAICRLVGVQATSCLSAIEDAVSIIPSTLWNTMSALDPHESAHAMNILNISIIQFAVAANSSHQLLVQPLVSGAWRFFGWAAVYDWLSGTREVFVFQGDEGSLVLLSEATDYLAYSANPLELPQQACQYFWYMSVYVSVVLSIVALLVVGVECQTRACSCARDLFQFNRVAGFVWIGRPALLLRATTAIVILSTSPIYFATYNGIAHFVFKARSWVELAVVAQEATWLSYIVVDLLLPIFPHDSHMYAAASAGLAWAAIVFLELLDPFVATASIHASCDILALGLSVRCFSGEVQIGSLMRLLTLISINAGSVVLCFAAYALYKWLRLSKSVSRRFINHVLLPGPSETFLDHSTNCHWYFDKTKMVLSGILPWRDKMFDVNLWLLVSAHRIEATQRKLQLKPSVVDISAPLPYVWSRAKVVVGFFYVIFTVAGSYSYIYLSQSAMTNDFWWARFNSSGHQTFLVNWFTRQLQLNRVVLNVDLTTPAYSDASMAYNLSQTTTSVPMLYASMVQDEVNTLGNVVQGLRNMDGCYVPWIATPLCYVDFNQTWEMAVSAYRQTQCANSHAQNGAVYMESYLRNANWAELYTCWHSSLDVGIFAHVATSEIGRSWMRGTQKNTLPVAAEVRYWQQHGIMTFETLWQSYKLLGVVETFSIQSAFGFTYPMTLKYSNGSFHTEHQTSFKLQWPIASLFWAIANNASGIGGYSLVRQSPKFAFANTTIEASLFRNGTLETPLGAGFALMRSTLGPYGSINAKRLAPPEVLCKWFQRMSDLIAVSARASSAAAAALSAIPSGLAGIVVVPEALAKLQSAGNDVLCDAQQPQNGTFSFFTNSGVCQLNVGDGVFPTAIAMIASVLAVGPLEVHDVEHTCSLVTSSDDSTCRGLLSAAATFADAYIDPVISSATHELSWGSAAAIEPIYLVEYAVNGTDLMLARFDLMANLKGAIGLFSWLYLTEWVQGFREVVAFEGLHGRLVTISERNPLAAVSSNPLEVPLNVAYYASCGLMYNSSVLLMVACAVVVYSVVNRGFIEGANMFVINRVAGLVWIGRPLLLLRSATALCLLSTAEIELRQVDGLYYMASTSESWFTTVMAAGEITWLVFILNDAFSVVTKQYTAVYATKSSLGVWCAAAIWSLVSPVQHSAALKRDCIIVTVDLQIECHSGVVAIGSPQRLLGLAALSLASVLGGYVVQRLRFPRLAPHLHSSFWLYATAKYHYDTSTWMHKQVYYIDKASALITGLVSVQVDGNIFILDIKTWRRYCLNETHSNISTDALKYAPHLRYTIPLQV